MPALSGPQGHPELSEEYKIHDQQQVTGETEVRENCGTENNGNEEVGPQSAGQPEDGSQKEHHPVGDSRPRGAVRDHVDIGLIKGLSYAPLHLRPDPGHGSHQDKPVVEDHEERDQGVDRLGQ